MTTPACLMVRVAAGAPNDALLKLALDAAARLKATKVIGISARQPIQIYGSPEMYVPPELVTWDLEQIDKELKAAESSFRAAFAGKVATVEWRSTVVTYGTIADYVGEQMRAADLLVTAVPDGGMLLDGSRHANVADLALRAGRPVLVVAAAQDRLDLRSVVVGWLAGHGVTATALAAVQDREEAGQLRRMVRELDAGLVVGGAYGHTRLREWVLGGITRDLLLRPLHCSLVSH